MNIIDIIGYWLVLLGAVYWLGVIHSTGNWRGERRRQKRSRPSWLQPNYDDLFENERPSTPSPQPKISIHTSIR